MAAQAAGMNKMLVMLPMIWLMGKIDFETGHILWYARICFFAMQVVQALVVWFIRAQVEHTADRRTTILVPEAQAPSFGQETEAKSIETTYYAHESAKVKEWLTQCAMGACISSLIHFKFGVNQVVVMQSVMIPLNLFDQPLFRKYIRHMGNVWGEHTPDGKKKINENDKLKKSESEESFEPVLNASGAIVNCWDHPTTETVALLYQMVKDSPNVQSTDDGWTALMVLSGVPIDTCSILAQLLELSDLDVTITDHDGWNVLHWCAYHNAPASAKTILAKIPKSKCRQLSKARSKDGKNPLEVAQEQKNTEIFAILESFAEQTLDESKEESNIRQRKKGVANE